MLSRPFGKKIAVKFVLETFFNKNVTRKKKSYRSIKRNDEKHASLNTNRLTEDIFAVYFFSCRKGANNIIAVKKLLV